MQQTNAVPPPPKLTHGYGHFLDWGAYRARTPSLRASVYGENIPDPGYKPTYWENPQRVARYYSVIQSQKPLGWTPPDWLNSDEITAAYDYLKSVNQDKPWWEWKYLHPDDPGRTFLQGIAQPPNEMLWPDETAQYAQYVPTPTEQLPNPSEGGMTTEQWEALPAWQRIVIPLMQNPLAMGVIQSAPFAGMALLTGNVPAAGIALGMGAGLGALQTPAVAEAVAPVFGATPEQYQTTLASVMYDLFGILPEAMSRAIGLGEQAYGAAVAPDKYGSFAELWNNLPAAWRAGHFMLQNIPVGLPGEEVGKTVWKLGEPTPVPQVGALGIAGLTEERRSLASGDAKTLLDQGAPLDEVYAQMGQRYGFTGEVKNLIGQTALYILGERAVRGVTKFGVEKYAEITENKPLAEAAKLGAGRPIETLQAYKEVLIGKPIEELSNMGVLERWLTGVTKEGEYTGLEPGNVSRMDRIRSGLVAGGIGGLAGYALGGPGGAIAGVGLGFPIGYKSTYLSRMSPAAQANEIVNNSSEVLAEVIARSSDDPATTVRYIHSLANTPTELAKDLSMETINSPYGSAIPLFLKENVKNIDNLYAAYEAGKPLGVMVDRLAEITGKTGNEVLQSLADAKDTSIFLKEVIEKARPLAAAGDKNAQTIVLAYDDAQKPLHQLPPDQQLTPEKLQEMAKMFTGADAIPRTPDDFKAQAWGVLMSGADEWAAKYFNVAPEPAWARLGQTVKAAQSVALLGLNPTYLVNNFLNNFVTMAARGNFGLRTPEAIANFWSRVGIEPARLRAGIGPVALGPEQFKSAIREASVQPGILTDINRLLSEKVGKLMIFSRLSMGAEKMASMQATTQGMTQAWNKLWRPGSGFDQMPPALEDTINQINPNLSGWIYAAVKSGLNQGEVEANLWEGLGKLSIDRGIPRVVEQMNKGGVSISEARVKDMLAQSGVYDVLNESLKTAQTNEDIQRAFQDVNRTVDTWLDTMSKDALQAKAVQVAAKIKTEGLAGVIKLWDDMQLNFNEVWGEHFTETGETAAKARENPKQASQLWQTQKLRDDQRFGRLGQQDSATYLGIFEGLGIDNETSRNILSYYSQNRDNWKTFYKESNAVKDQYFQPDVVSTRSWADVQREISALYQTHATEEIKLSTAMDNAFIETIAQQHPDLAAQVATWRQGMTVFHQERAGRWTRFFEYLNTVKPEDRNAEFIKFFNAGIPGVVDGGHMTFLRNYFQAQIDGAHALYGKPGPAVPEMPILPTQPPAAPTVIPVTHPPATGTPEEIQARFAAQYEKTQAELAKMQTEAAVPFMITNKMRDQLAMLSYTREEVARMTPQEAWDNINRGTTNPARVAASFPTEPEPVRQINLGNIREVAARYGVATATNEGFYTPGSDTHILNAIKKYGGPEAANYQSLADVDPLVAEKAFQARQADHEAFMATSEKPVKPEGPIVDYFNVTTKEMKPYLAKETTAVANMMRDMISGAQVYHGKANEVRLPDGTTEVVPLHGTENPPWYTKLYDEGFTSKETMLNALQRIVDGEDRPGLKYVDRMKSLILEVLSGENPDVIGEYQPSIPYLMDMGMRPEAVKAFGRLFDEGLAAEMSDADWIKMTGSKENLDQLMDLWSRQVAAEPLPHPSEVAQEGFVMGAGQIVVPPETQAIMDAITQRERIIAHTEEAKATVDNGVTLLSAGDAREMLHDSAVRIFGVSAEEADGIIAITDARAQLWAKQTGRSAAEWYSTRFGGLVRGGPAGEEVLYQSATAPIWYSQLQRVVEGIPQERLTAEQMRGMIAKAGVKADELKWTGFDEWLKGKTKITKQEALDYLDTNRVNVEETVKGGVLSQHDYDQRIQDFDYRLGQLMGEMQDAEQKLNAQLVDAKVPQSEVDFISNYWGRGGEERARQVLGNNAVEPYANLADQWRRLGDERNQLAAERRGATGGTRYDIYQVPGGENYRELLLTLPTGRGAAFDEAQRKIQTGEPFTPADEAAIRATAPEYISAHWQEPNVLAHVRFNDRTSADGKKVLFVEEIQSDWHQAGREQGYITPEMTEVAKRTDKAFQDYRQQMVEKYNTQAIWAFMNSGEKGRWTLLNDAAVATQVPTGGVFAAPFAKTWPELTMKRVLRWAAENGYDQVAWTTGEQQINRWSHALRQVADEIHWVKDPANDRVTLTSFKDNKLVGEQYPKLNEVHNYIGDEAAGKILDNPSLEGKLDAKDLVIGGAGMRAFYDEMLPNAMNKYAKKWGARVGETDIGSSYKLVDKSGNFMTFRNLDLVMEAAQNYQKAFPDAGWHIDAIAGNAVHSLDITPEMRQSVLEGQPLFQGPKGAAEFLDDGRVIIHAMEAPDVSTLVHEIGHVFRRDLSGDDLAITEEWAGVQNGVWEAAHEEKFARGFERYLAEGIAPTTGLQAVFENFKRWLLRVYTAITGSAIDVKITPEMRGVLDRLLSEAPTAPVEQAVPPVPPYEITDTFGRVMQPAKPQQAEMFAPEQVMPLFTGTPMRGQESLFRPTGEAQPIMPGLTEAYVPKMGEAVPGGTAEGAGPMFPTREGMQVELNRIENLLTASDKEQRRFDTILKWPKEDQKDLVAQWKALGKSIRTSFEAEGTEPQLPRFREVKGFEGFIPGTPEWLAFWNAHPELQQEMLRWRSKWFNTDTGPKRLFQGQVQDSDGSVSELPKDQPALPGMGAMGAADNLETQPPIAQIMDEGFNSQLRPLLKELERYLMSPDAKVPDTLKNLGEALQPEVLRDLKAYLGKVYGQMSDTKLASIRWAQNRRDAALLNYSKRYGFDNVLSLALPYEFWYTRTALNWALGAIDHPLWMMTYANLRRMQRNLVQTPGFPTRLTNKMKIPIPFLPDWMGGGAYIDPLKQLFPFEQFAKPFEQAGKDQSQVLQRTETNILQMVQDEEISQTDAQTALDTQQGAIWDKAQTQAKMDISSDTSDPYSFIGLLMGWSLPIQWAYYGLTGQKNKIGALPITRMVNAVTGALGLNQGRGYNLEGPIRRTLGMPELDEFTDYRVDRMLANMAAEGLITADDAQRAMLDRSGPAFLQAQQRVSKMGQYSYFGAPVGLDFFPEGEQKQRAISLEYDKARDAWLNGDTKAMTTFFDAYPEYQARMALYRDPESRLKQFMISEVWNKYRQLPDLYQKQMRDQLGDQFNQAFLDKETRSYDSINTQTLAMWAQAMGSTLPTAAGTIPEAPVTLASPEVAQAYKDFRDQVNQRWPNIYSVQNIYYRIPAGKVQDAYAAKHPEIDQYNQFENAYFAAHPEIVPYATGEKNKVNKADPQIQALYYQYQAQRDQQFPNAFKLQDQYYALPTTQRKAFRTQYPELPAYWDWRREFLRQYPQMIPYIVSTESLAEAYLGESVTTPTVQPVTTTNTELTQLTPVLLRQLYGYYQSGQALSEGAQKELQRIWTSSGKPTGSYKDWLDTVVKPLFMSNK